MMVLFDDPSVGRVNGANGHEAIAIESVTAHYIFHGRSFVCEASSSVPCWTFTIHKVQGIAFDKIVADLRSTAFENDMVKVAFSRVRTLESLIWIHLSLN